MDSILYKHLLRRVVTYPITFSRNKNFDDYESKEGSRAIKRAKVIQFLINQIEKNNFIGKKTDKDFVITIEDKKISLEDNYIINLYELNLIMENLDNRESLMKLMLLKE